VAYEWVKPRWKYNLERPSR